MSVSSIRRLFRSERGTSAVEFGIVALPLFMLAFGIFEFARLYWTQEALQESATAGARCMGILQSSCASSGTYNSANTVSYVQGVAANWGITVPSADIVPTNSTSCGGSTGFSQVLITYTFTTLIPNIIPIPRAGKVLTLTSCYPNNQ